MHKILNEIRNIIDENIAFYLPHVKSNDLEKSGAVFYMNGKDGTAFDWYVNDKLPPFMIFYNDKDNLGAAKLLLYNDGKIELFLYDEKGKKLVKTVHASVESDKEAILLLAATLKNEADDKMIWDADIEAINTDMKMSTDGLNQFEDMQKNYIALKNKKNILNLSAYVSKKITEEGWKVAYMERNKPSHKMDSGWFFAAGNEEDSYLSDYKNIALLPVGIVWQQFDSDIFKYIDMPIGTKLIRTSPKDFEIDKGDKDLYLLKR